MPTLKTYKEKQLRKVLGNKGLRERKMLNENRMIKGIESDVSWKHKNDLMCSIDCNNYDVTKCPRVGNPVLCGNFKGKEKQAIKKHDMLQYVRKE